MQWLHYTRFILRSSWTHIQFVPTCCVFFSLSLRLLHSTSLESCAQFYLLSTRLSSKTMVHWIIISLWPSTRVPCTADAPNLLSLVLIPFKPNVDVKKLSTEPKHIPEMQVRYYSLLVYSPCPLESDICMSTVEKLLAEWEYGAQSGNLNNK